MTSDKKPRKAAPTKTKPPKKPKPGTSREAAAQRKIAFVEAYIANGENGTGAAITAGFSTKTAGSMASRLLKDVNVQSLLKERRKALADKYALTSENVIQSLARAVHFDPRKLYNADGSLKRIVDLDDDTAAALAGVEVVEMAGDSGSVPMFTKKVKWLDKNAARDQAMKHLGLFKEDNEQRRGALDDLPREMVKAILERINGLKR